MDHFKTTEADLPLRNVATHLRDVAFQHLVEGPGSAIHAMYVQSAIKAGATQDDIDDVDRFCSNLGLGLITPQQARQCIPWAGAVA